jgi:hypothetical protein
MFSYTNLNQQIPIKITFLAQLYRFSITNPLRYHNLFFHILILYPTTPTIGTKLLDLGPLTITRVTRSLHDKRALSHCLRPSTITRVALGWVGPRFAFAALAGLAFYGAGVLDGLTLVKYDTLVVPKTLSLKSMVRFITLVWFMR